METLERTTSAAATATVLLRHKIIKKYLEEYISIKYPNIEDDLSSGNGYGCGNNVSELLSSIIDGGCNIQALQAQHHALGTDETERLLIKNLIDLIKEKKKCYDVYVNEYITYIY